MGLDALGLLLYWEVRSGVSVVGCWERKIPMHLKIDSGEQDTVRLSGV